jgi:hypothetical protein
MKPARKLTCRALQERYGVVDKTIDRWVQSGVLPAPMYINTAAIGTLMRSTSVTAIGSVSSDRRSLLRRGSRIRWGPPHEKAPLVGQRVGARCR